ncbi:NAD(P)-binding protein [Glonium stellatum]|uniref:NAD(P)-binding protein n=1 Tax=Glonium stellatum TaxID=574774 RepID=A0A8E2EYV7_9PEZI|nr:NAD(P)-binding protein [Glonium stellatum]
MPPRTPDVRLADNFTTTIHSKPTTSTNPAGIKLSTPFVVCIIGVSRGIGASIAYAYALAGASGLVLAARSADQLKDVESHVKDIQPSIHTLNVNCDITSADSVANLAACVRKEFDRLDVLVVNSGFSGPVVLRVEDGDPADFQRAFDVNIQGTYLAAHYFLPLLRRAEGGAKSFIAVGSMAAYIIRGPIANTGYCLSKFAQSRFVEFLAEQYEKEGLFAVAVHPGAVATEMAKGSPESFKKYLVDDPMLCGSFCVWLTKERRMWLNGRLLSATWDVDELMEKEKDIETRDLLKWGYRSDRIEL